jgi:site-specific DNA-cytosine methylase
MDRLKQLGNAIVPQIAEWIGKRIMEVNNEKTIQKNR